MIIQEEWRPVINGTYEVSSEGRVRRARDGRPRSLKLDRDGYPIFLVKSNGGGWHEFRVHRLVAMAFLGSCPPGLQVNHKSGVKTDNRVANLEYVTPKENAQHASRLGLLRRHKADSPQRAVIPGTRDPQDEPGIQEA